MRTEILQKALHFAAEAHQGQKIPGTDLPYLVHLVEVYSELVPLIREQTELDFDLLLPSALLHDTIEDTKVTFEVLYESFGEKIAQAVLALSKNATLPKEIQMQDSLTRILAQPQEVRIIKMADRISNLSEPPSYWQREKRQYYQREAVLILAQLGKGISPFIEKRLAEKIQQYAQYF